MIKYWCSHIYDTICVIALNNLYKKCKLMSCLNNQVLAHSKPRCKHSHALKANSIFPITTFRFKLETRAFLNVHDQNVHAYNVHAQQNIHAQNVHAQNAHAQQNVHA